MSQIKGLPIILASDFPIFRDSLKSQCNKIAEVKLVACASSRDEVLPLLESHRPNLVLLDLNLDPLDLCALLDDIHDHSDVRSLVMSDNLDNGQVIKMLQHGAHGVVSRRASPELLSKSITSVLAGEFWISRAVVRDFLHQMRQAMPIIEKASISLTSTDIGQTAPSAVSITSARAPESGTSRFGLTRRENQIIGAVVDGQTNKDIANTFGISEYTVKHHLTSVYDKLGVYNRVELVLFAMNQGVVQPNAASRNSVR